MSEMESPPVRVPVPAPAPPAASPEKPPVDLAARKRWWRRAFTIVIAMAVVSLSLPHVIHSLHTVSTDDAYVNSYVTFVAPRVAGQVSQVLVDDNYRVKKGDVLVQLDPEPYHVQLAIKQAALDTAEADLVTAQATVLGQVGQLRSLRFQLDHAIEDVDNQVALLKARAATLDQAKAALVYAQAEFQRAQHLLSTKVISSEEYDQKREAIDAAKAQVDTALENVQQTRAALGIPRDPGVGKSLTDVPADIDQNFSVRAAGGRESDERCGHFGGCSLLVRSHAQADDTRSSTSGTRIGDINRIFAETHQGRADLEASPGGGETGPERPRPGETRPAVLHHHFRNRRRRHAAQCESRQTTCRSAKASWPCAPCDDIWVDANFKETQLAQLADRPAGGIWKSTCMAAGSEFKGRISGFTMGTGSTLALLPAQNATGNFVKVVQRLPVRIDVVDYDPDKIPLFVGLSVEPDGRYRRARRRGQTPAITCRKTRTLPSRPGDEQRIVAHAGSASATAQPRAINPWIVAVAVVIPTFMEVLDTTIANVALRYIAGGLSAPVTDSEWVITSYLAANAIILPISGWLAVKLGRRNYFLLSIAVFTLASALCGMAASLGMLIAARVLQGFAGGGLQPSSQGVLLDTFPPEKQGAAMTMFSVAALLAPVVGSDARRIHHG